MKEVKPQASAKLSPMFMEHLRQTRELAKKDFIQMKQENLEKNWINLIK